MSGAPPPPPRPPTAAELLQADKDALAHIQIELCRADTTSPQTYARYPTVQAMTLAKIETLTDLLQLSEIDLSRLEYYRQTTDANNNRIVVKETLPVGYKACLRAAIAFFHHKTRQKGSRISVRTELLRAEFDQFRTGTHYDPNQPIVVWSRPLPADSRTAEEIEISNWSKSVKIDKKAYKELRDDNHWVTWRKKMITTANAQKLGHILQTDFQVTNKELDKQQNDWMFDVLDTIVLAPMGRDIVSKHCIERNARKCWGEIDETYKSSMTAILRSQTLSSYLTGTRLHEIEWRGSLVNWIIHWAKQLREHNDISENPFKDPHAIALLNTAVSGVPCLSGVYNNHIASLQAGSLAAGKPFVNNMTLTEYTNLLVQKAAVYDAGNTKGSRSRGRRANAHMWEEATQRELNAHDFYGTFEQPDDYDHEDDDGYEAAVHDYDTPVEAFMEAFMGNQKGSAPPKAPVRLNADVWRSLSKEGKTTWDQMSEQDKLKIISASRPKKTIPPSNTTIPGFKGNGSSKNFRSDRQASAHEQGEQDDVTDEDRTELAQLDVNVHSLKKAPKSKAKSKAKKSLMDMAANGGNSPKDVELTINNIMSKKRTVGIHEVNHTEFSHQEANSFELEKSFDSDEQSDEEDSDFDDLPNLIRRDQMESSDDDETESESSDDDDRDWPEAYSHEWVGNTSSEHTDESQANAEAEDRPVADDDMLARLTSTNVDLSLPMSQQSVVAAPPAASPAPNPYSNYQLGPGVQLPSITTTTLQQPSPHNQVVRFAPQDDVQQLPVADNAGTTASTTLQPIVGIDELRMLMEGTETIQPTQPTNMPLLQNAPAQTQDPPVQPQGALSSMLSTLSDALFSPTEESTSAPPDQVLSTTQAPNSGSSGSTLDPMNLSQALVPHESNVPTIFHEPQQNVQANRRPTGHASAIMHYNTDAEMRQAMEDHVTELRIDIGTAPNRSVAQTFHHYSLDFPDQFERVSCRGIIPWKKAAFGNTYAIWEEDHWEIYMMDVQGRVYFLSVRPRHTNDMLLYDAVARYVEQYWDFLNENPDNTVEHPGLDLPEHIGQHANVRIIDDMWTRPANTTPRSVDIASYASVARASDSVPDSPNRLFDTSPFPYAHELLAGEPTPLVSILEQDSKPAAKEDESDSKPAPMVTQPVPIEQQAPVPAPLPAPELMVVPPGDPSESYIQDAEQRDIDAETTGFDDVDLDTNYEADHSGSEQQVTVPPAAQPIADDEMLSRLIENSPSYAEFRQALPPGTNPGRVERELHIGMRFNTPSDHSSSLTTSTSSGKPKTRSKTKKRNDQRNKKKKREQQERINEGVCAIVMSPFRPPKNDSTDSGSGGSNSGSNNSSPSSNSQNSTSTSTHNQQGPDGRPPAKPKNDKDFA